VLPADPFEMPEQRIASRHGEQRHAIPITLASTHDELSCSEVDVLQAQTRALEKPEPRTVEQHGHEARDAVEVTEDVADLFPGEYDGEPRGPLRAHDLVEPLRRETEDVSVEEPQGSQRLVLRR